MSISVEGASAAAAPAKKPQPTPKPADAKSPAAKANTPDAKAPAASKTAAAAPKAAVATPSKAAVATPSKAAVATPSKAAAATPSKAAAATPKAAAATPKAAAATPKVAAAPKAAAKAGEKKTAAPGERRGPGRPPSNPPAPPIPRLGVVDVPREDPDHIFELVTDTPCMFKSLFAYFKNIRAREIHVRFLADTTTFFTWDHHETCRAIGQIQGKFTNSCYCEKELWFSINREKVEKMFAGIDKAEHKLTVAVHHAEPDAILFIIEDLIQGVKSTYKFTVTQIEPTEELVNAEKELHGSKLTGPQCVYPLQFVLDKKEFKRALGGIAAYSDTLTFEKIGGHPLQIAYAVDNLTYRRVYSDVAKIKLVSTVNEGTTFRCRAKTETIKSLASSMVTDTVTIYCREDGDILFQSAVEAELVVSTLMKTSPQ